jgi:NAD(P)-dependent dehydrogenase (short-subunit alcohol dehydrogenase family)
MAKVFITGSADGLGKLAAQLLVKDHHDVFLHARNEARGKSAIASVPGAKGVIIGDLSSIEETKSVAAQVNKHGTFDAVIFNAAIGYQEPGRKKTVDNLSQLFAINSLAPYILTCLIARPKRLIYMSSGMHRGGDASLQDLNWENRPWRGSAAYSDSKLHNAILAFAVARKWPGVFSNTVDPGWVPTKMGGAGAPDNLEEGAKTQAWLAVSDDKNAMVSGKLFFHKKVREAHPKANDVLTQEKFLDECYRFSKVAFTEK